MFETMYDAQGIGLAAPQVGVSKRVIVVDVQEEGGRAVRAGQPRASWSEPETDRRPEEGCLSIPGVGGVVERPPPGAGGD
jgi:peptide deformylase